MEFTHVSTKLAGTESQSQYTEITMVQTPSWGECFLLNKREETITFVGSCTTWHVLNGEYLIDLAAHYGILRYYSITRMLCALEETRKYNQAKTRFKKTA